jgi:hypothetical protein
MRFSFAALTVLAFSSTLALRADDATPTPPVSIASLLQQETDFSTLPMHRGWRTNLTSSHDPTGGNGDYQQFVSLQGDHAVLADLKGPGAIVRFWTTAVYKKPDGGLTADPSGQLKIFIDDNPTPVIDEPFVDFFDKHEPFTKPLTDHYGAATITYFPIPYAKHCLVTLDKPQGQFYQIVSLAFPQGTPVKPFALPLTAEEQAALTVAGKAWNEASRQRTSLLFTMPVQTLAPGKTLESHSGGAEFGSSGSGFVKSVTLAGLEPATHLRDLILRAWFDDHRTPDIEVPVADFFGNAFGTKSFNSFFLENFGGMEMVCRFPMPYRSHARFSLENRGSQPVSVNFKVEYVATHSLAPGTEYFHADFNQEITQKGKAHAWLKIAGQAGHFVGVVQTMQGNQTLGFCEGDSQVRVDEQPWGKTTKDFPYTVVGPWNGTGTEDDFNSAWYFQDGIISRPMNGCLVREDLGRIDCYRFFVNDAPVWQDSIDAQIEIGGLNDADGIYYSSVAFWYGAGERKQPPTPLPANLDFPRVKFVDRNSASTVIEGESLTDTAKPSGGQAEKENLPGLLDTWSDGAQLAWDGGKKGDTLDLVINIPKAGDYSLQAYVGHGPAYGAFNIAIAGKALPWNDDAYDTEPHNVRQDWGQATLPAGPCHITVKQMDTDGRSKGTRFGLDFIDLHLDKAAAP